MLDLRMRLKRIQLKHLLMIWQVLMLLRGFKCKGLELELTMCWENPLQVGMFLEMLLLALNLSRLMGLGKTSGITNCLA